FGDGRRKLGHYAPPIQGLGASRLGHVKAWARQGLATSRLGRGWRWQPNEAGTPFEIEQQAKRQGREYGRRRHPSGIEQVGDPMIADVEEMKRAVGAKEQTGPIEAGPEFLRHVAAPAAGERRVKN